MANQISIPGCQALEDNSQYTNRFEIASETSNRLYVIAQNKATGEWSCSCPGWIIKRAGKERTCKHLKSILPILLESAKVAPKRIEEKVGQQKKRKIQV